MATGIIPNDEHRHQRGKTRMARTRKTSPEEYPEAVRELLQRIDQRMATLKLNDKTAAQMAGVGVDWIRDIRRRGHVPKADKLAALANVLGVPTSYLLDAVNVQPSQAQLQPMLTLSTIHVMGDVQAGVWREAVQWAPVDWFTITVPADSRFPGVERFGLLVRGDSMDKVYPDGTIVIVVRYSDIGRGPFPGERVVVMRRSATGSEFEATLKEYLRDARGRHLFWPRSNDPDYQQPLIVEGTDIVTDRRFPEQIEAKPSAGEEVTVSALVLGSYKPETPIYPG